MSKELGLEERRRQRGAVDGDEAAVELVARLVDGARGIPGVRAVSVASQAPFMGAYKGHSSVSGSTLTR